MAKDLALFEAAEADPTTPPVFRLYAWDPPCISVGYNQAIENIIDLEAVTADGIDVVTRPTGGRALLHSQELTYAIAASHANETFSGSIRISHQRIAEVFVDALRDIGVHAEFSKKQEPRHQSEFNRIPCFATVVGSELVVGGRKVLGSAQRRGLQAFMQHGSLMIGSGHLDLVRYLLNSGTTTLVRRDALERVAAHVDLGSEPSALIQSVVSTFQDRVEQRGFRVNKPSAPETGTPGQR